MPISSDEWNEGRAAETMEARVLTFLQAHRGEGFTNVEIAERIGQWFRFTKSDDFGSGALKLIENFGSLWEINEALKTLIREGRVEARRIKKRIGEETYYKAI